MNKKIVAAMLLAGLATPAMAQDQLAPQAQAQTIRPQDPASLVSAMQNAGYRAVLTTDPSGDPMINSSTSGLSFSVFFYGCTNNESCSTIQFYAGFRDPENASLRAMNDWNRENRFGRAYVSEDGSARVEMDVDMDDGGISEALFHDNLEFWEITLSNFEEYIFSTDADGATSG